MMFEAPLLAVYPGVAIALGGAGPEPDGRRPARPARPQTREAAMTHDAEDRFRLRRGLPLVRRRARIALERALERLGDDIAVELHFQPFELNPTMGAEGADAARVPDRQVRHDATSSWQRTAQRIAERGAAVGFTFGERERVWNTFDAHRLLHWAGVEGPPGSQRALKHALLQAYHGEGRNPGCTRRAARAGRRGRPRRRSRARGAGARRVCRRGARSRAVLATGRHRRRCRPS